MNHADREVYGLIESRQTEALGTSEPARIDPETYPQWQASSPEGPNTPYAFTPTPRTSEVPESFVTSQTAASSQPAVSTAPAVSTPQPISHDGRAGHAAERPPATQPAEVWTLSLGQALAYAFDHSRDLRRAREDLYLAALALSLERHLWTPQLMGEVRTRYANYGQIRRFDHAMDVVAEFAVEQRLPYGGEVTARVINTLMRDLTNHVTTGETGAMIFEANVPLLRGAGRAAYESRYQAERDLVYAIRTFERFRRELAVVIAGEFFQLQTLKQQIVNESESIKSFTEEASRARALWQTGRLLQLEVQRAEQDRLVAINRKVDAVEAYQTALDAFKIRIGMPTETEIDVSVMGDPAAELTAGPDDLTETPLIETIRMPRVPETEAVRVALKYRLDLINDFDRIDDARRAVGIAENSLLPDLTAAGSVQMDTNTGEEGFFKYDSERVTWRGELTLELPLDRKAERNALRARLIDKRRAQRNYDEARDRVELQVRRAMRQVTQQQESLRIQMLSRDVALQRRRAARIRFDQGRVSNREVVDAENALLVARNRLAQAQARVRLAILEFRRDTGTLRIDESGQWYDPDRREGLASVE